MAATRTTRKATAKDLHRMDVRQASGLTGAHRSVYKAGASHGKTAAKRGDTSKTATKSRTFNVGSNMAKSSASRSPSGGAVGIRKAAQKRKTTR